MDRKGIFAVILVCLIVVPLVSATKLSCQTVLPPKPSSVYCNLTGQGNISIRIVAFDGVSVKDYYDYCSWTKIYGKSLGLKKLTEPVLLKSNSTAEMEILVGQVSETMGAVLNGLFTTIKENIWPILALLFFVLVSWVLKTIRLVTGNVPERADTEDTPGISDLLLVLFMVSGLIYALLIHLLKWVLDGNALDAYVPSLLTLSFLAAMTVFEWAEFKDRIHISTGLEWIPPSALAYQDGLQHLFLTFPLILLIGRFERPRNILRRVSPVVSALWLVLGFLVRVFPPEALLWLGPVFGVYLYILTGNSK